MSSDWRSAPELNGFTATLIDDLTALIWQAGSTILGITASRCATKLKQDRSPVCEADLKAQAIIMAGLANLCPRLPVVSEEAEAPEHQLPINDVFALVDPLDGTREFLGGRGEFTVNIAILIKGTPVIGLVAAPTLGKIWRGVLHRGAERLRITSGSGFAFEAEPIRTRRAPAEGLVIAVSRSHFDPCTASLLARLKVSQELPCGSSLKFCGVAEGQADLYPRLAPIREWDVAAGQAVVTAAGGTMVAPDGRPVRYGGVQQRFCLPGFLAMGDPSLAPEILRYAQEASRATPDLAAPAAGLPQ